MEGRLRVGVISSTHGLLGEVKVFPTTDDAKRFKTLKRVYLDDKGEGPALEIENVKFFKRFAILKLKGIEDIDEAKRYKGKSLWIDRTAGALLEENEFYIADLLGMEVFTEEGEYFGVLTDVLETGANDVYIVDSKEWGETLLPAVRECILRVDTKNNKMSVRLMDGLTGQRRGK